VGVRARIFLYIAKETANRRIFLSRQEHRTQLALVAHTAHAAYFSGGAADVAPPRSFSPENYALTLPGAGPLGYFDPAGVAARLRTEGQVRFFREAELKHSRIAMLATVGFVAGELLGVNTLPEVLGAVAFKEAASWPVASAGLYPWGVAKTFDDGTPRIGGDFRFDPLGLRPRKPFALQVMQGRELVLGRLAMLGIVGMIAQEAACGTQLLCALR